MTTTAPASTSSAGPLAAGCRMTAPYAWPGTAGR